MPPVHHRQREGTSLQMWNAAFRIRSTLFLADAFAKLGACYLRKAGGALRLGPPTIVMERIRGVFKAGRAALGNSVSVP